MGVDGPVTVDVVAGMNCDFFLFVVASLPWLERFGLLFSHEFDHNGFRNPFWTLSVEKLLIYRNWTSSWRGGNKLKLVQAMEKPRHTHDDGRKDGEVIFGRKT